MCDKCADAATREAEMVTYLAHQISEFAKYKKLDILSVEKVLFLLLTSVTEEIESAIADLKTKKKSTETGDPVSVDVSSIRDEDFNKAIFN
jgi:hypothetical protein